MLDINKKYKYDNKFYKINTKYKIKTLNKYAIIQSEYNLLAKTSINKKIATINKLNKVSDLQFDFVDNLFYAHFSDGDFRVTLKVYEVA